MLRPPGWRLGTQCLITMGLFTNGALPRNEPPRRVRDTPKSPDSPGRFTLHRTEFLSDGVLAIAMTLLVLDLAVSGYQEHPLGTELLHHWPAYAAFFS